MEETRNASSVYCVSQDDRNIMLKVSSPSMDDDTFSHLLNMEFNPFMAHLMEGEEEGFVPPLNNLAPPPLYGNVAQKITFITFVCIFYSVRIKYFSCQLEK